MNKISFQNKEGNETYRALFLDEYALTMAQSFFWHKRDDQVSFEYFVRTLPKNRGYLLSAGLETALDALRSYEFRSDDLDYLKESGYDKKFLSYLYDLTFAGDIWAIPEGTVYGPGTPSLRLTANRIVATLVESSLLSILNHQTTIATKAARIVQAASGAPVWDFSLRRLHGPRAAIGVARAAFIAGCAGTATVEAGRVLRIPTTGTMAHHYVQAYGFDGEEQGFEDFLLDYPHKSILLPDTYETIRGTKNAIQASNNTGVPLKGLRLDSGNLDDLSRKVRVLLDTADMPNTKITASNDLDEYKIEALRKAGAPIDSYGVGTMLGTAADAPALPGVYKLVEQLFNGVNVDVMKVTPTKATDPGCHQVFRKEMQDTIALASEILEGTPLLEKVMENGELTRANPTLKEIQRHAKLELSNLPASVKALRNPKIFEPLRSPVLMALKNQLIISSQKAVHTL